MFLIASLLAATPRKNKFGMSVIILRIIAPEPFYQSTHEDMPKNKNPSSCSAQFF
jgi:hypothetical protein